MDNLIQYVLGAVVIYNVIMIAFVQFRLTLFRKLTNRWYIPKAIKQRRDPIIFYSGEKGTTENLTSTITGIALPLIIIAITLLVLTINLIAGDKAEMTDEDFHLFIFWMEFLFLAPIYIYYPIYQFLKNNKYKNVRNKMAARLLLTKAERAEMAVGAFKEDVEQ